MAGDGRSRPTAAFADTTPVVYTRGDERGRNERRRPLRAFFGRLMASARNRWTRSRRSPEGDDTVPLAPRRQFTND